LPDDQGPVEKNCSTPHITLLVCNIDALIKAHLDLTFLKNELSSLPSPFKHAVALLYTSLVPRVSCARYFVQMSYDPDPSILSGSSKTEKSAGVKKKGTIIQKAEVHFNPLDCPFLRTRGGLIIDTRRSSESSNPDDSSQSFSTDSSSCYASR